MASPRKVNLVDFNTPQFGGPYAIHALALDAAAAPIVEGCWVPIFGAKVATVELTGKMDTLGVDVWGSNSLEDPGNSYALTVGGSETDGDVITLNITNPNLQTAGNVVAVPVTTAGGQSINSIAAALAAGINSNASLSALGIVASVVNAVITLAFPSFAPQSGNSSPSQPAIANTTTVSYTQGDNTETIAIVVGTNGIKIGSTLAAFGLTTLTILPRWVKMRLGTLTGSGANVSGRFSAAA